jgi:hypothetical protein
VAESFAAMQAAGRDFLASFNQAPKRDPSREVPPIMHIIGCLVSGPP